MTEFEEQEPGDVLSTMWKFPNNLGMQNRDFYVTNGFVGFAETIVAGSSLDSHILLNKTVSDVRWRAPQNDDDLVAVLCTDGSAYKAQKVIVTVSLGVIQGAVAEDPAQILRFTPPLPPPKAAAFSKMIMGYYAVVEAVFPENFWGLDDEILFLSTENTGDLSWALNFDKYVPDSRTLQFHVAHDQALKYETQDLNDTARAIVDMLQVYLDTPDVPWPLSVSVSQWGQDPLFNGSYSTWPIGFYEEDYLEMIAPLDDKLFFSGEATDPDYFGYTHGGLVSGRNAVDDIFAASSYSYSYSFGEVASYSYDYY